MGPRVTLCRLALPLIAATLVAAGSASATTWTVDAGGGGDATMIGTAVGLASDGDTISIANGTYTEFATTEKALVFIAVNPGQVTWQGTGDGILGVQNATGIEVHGIGFSGGYSGLNFLSVGGTLKVWNCTFSNLTSAGPGAAIYSLYSKLDVSECEFSNCSSTYAGYGGGAIYAGYDSPGARVVTSTFTSCTAASDGGAMDLSCRDMTVGDCTFHSCSGDNGGAVRFRCQDSMVSNCTFEDNEAAGDGGAFYTEWQSGNTIVDCVFSTNTANGNGGAICTYADGSTGSVSNNLFQGNVALRGGAIYEEHNVLEYFGNTFHNNEASAAGAAFYIKAGSPEIRQSIFSSHQDCAAIYCESNPGALGCNDFWQNTSGNVDGCPEPQAADGNIFLDPQFCNAGAGNFELAQVSPCLAASAPAGCSGNMGRYDSGCVVSPVRVTSWGEIMNLFR